MRHDSWELHLVRCRRTIQDFYLLELLMLQRYFYNVPMIYRYRCHRIIAPGWSKTDQVYVCQHRQLYNHRHFTLEVRWNLPKLDGSYQIDLHDKSLTLCSCSCLVAVSKSTESFSLNTDLRCSASDNPLSTSFKFLLSCATALSRSALLQRQNTLLLQNIIPNVTIHLEIKSKMAELRFLSNVFEVMTRKTLYEA